MSIARILVAFFFFLTVTTANAQIPPQSFLSKPTNLPLVGWNKTLILHDGRTMVLHLEPRKPAKILVFDASHNEVLNTTMWFTMVEEVLLERSEFKGFFEINGKPVLFLQQVRENKVTLFRIQINPADGKIIDEQMVHQSKSAIEAIDHFVVKEEGTDNYAVFYYRNLRNLDLKEENDHLLKATIWNDKHKKIKTATFNVPYHEMVEMNFLGMGFYKTGGLWVSLSCGRRSDGSILENVQVGVLDEADTIFRQKEIPFGQAARPSYASFQYNKGQDKINMLITYTRYLVQDDISPTGYGTGSVSANTNAVGVFHSGNKKVDVVVTAEGSMAFFSHKDFDLMGMKKLSNEMVGSYARTNGNTTFAGTPIFFYTNDAGISHVISESVVEQGSESGNRQQTNFGPLGITTVSDEGDEVSGLFIPKSQYVYTVLPPGNIALRNVQKFLFRYRSEYDYTNQFTSFEYLPTSKGYTVFYNDYPTNFSKNFKEQTESVYYFDKAETICYSVNEKNEVKKEYLFGRPAKDESHSLMVESGNYNEEWKLYAALVSVRNGDKVQLCMGWRQIL